MRARNADLWSGLALAVLAAYIIVQASGWDYTGPDGPGAGFFPLWYGIAMLVLSAALVASSLLRAPEAVDWRGAGRAAAVSAALVVAVALFKLVGFAIGVRGARLFHRGGDVSAPVAARRRRCGRPCRGFYLIFPLLLGVNLP